MEYKVMIIRSKTILKERADNIAEGNRIIFRSFIFGVFK